MKYELTPDLITENKLIDEQHKQLFSIVNELMEACQIGKGRDKMINVAQFLSSYVVKHFADEESLQIESAYPNYIAHKKFHEDYKEKLNVMIATLKSEGATIKTLADLNKIISTLVIHIKNEDKNIAMHINSQKG